MNSMIPTVIPSFQITPALPKPMTPKEQVIMLLQKNGILSEAQVLTILSPTSAKPKDRLSEITVKRAIKDLTQAETIVKIKSDRFKEYCIYEKDKRIVYLALKQTEKERRLITTLLTTLSSKDQKEQEIALRELHDKFYLQLTPQHLTQLVTLLHEEKSWENGKSMFALEILKNHIQRGIVPEQNDRDTFTKDIHIHAKNVETLNKNLIEKLFELFGFLHDSYIIQIINHLAKKELLLKYKERLEQWYLSGAIGECDAELFQLQIKYKDKKETEQAIYEIRQRATQQYSIYKTNLEAARQSLKLPRP